MAGLKPLTAALACVVCVAATARAQPPQPPPPQTPPQPQGEDAWGDEPGWPDDGPDGRARPGAWGPAPGQTPPAAPPAEPPEPSILETSSHLVDLTVVFGFTTDESFDDALRAHGYAPSPATVFGSDVTSLWRVLPILWVGGRLGYRHRSWDQTGVPSVDAFAGAAWLVADLRIQAGRRWDFGLEAGAGGAAVGLYLGSGSDFHIAPGAYGGVSMGVTLAGPVRAYTRFGYEYLEAANINEWGHDLNLSGGSFGIGVEIRP